MPLPPERSSVVAAWLLIYSGRSHILKVLCTPLRCAEDLDFELLGQLTPGYVSFLE